MAQTLDRFADVYRRGKWKSEGVLSGEGSLLKNTLHLIDWLESEIESGARSILDLGCGDLEWIASCPSITSGKAEYYGVDVLPTLIAHHRRIYPWFDGEAIDLEEYIRPSADIVILKDVLPHHCNGRNEQQLLILQNSSWKRLLVTSHRGAPNRKRNGIRGAMWVPYDVEAVGILQSSVVKRIPRYDGGEYLIYGKSDKIPLL